MENDFNNVKIDGYEINIEKATKDKLTTYLDKTYKKVCDHIKEQNQLIEKMITKEETN